MTIRWVVRKRFTYLTLADTPAGFGAGTTHIKWLSPDRMDGTLNDLVTALEPTWCNTLGAAMMFTTVESAAAQALIHDAGVEEVKILQMAAGERVAKVMDSRGMLWDYTPNQRGKPITRRG
jgi:hypothetical protein